LITSSPTHPIFFGCDEQKGQFMKTIVLLMGLVFAFGATAQSRPAGPVLNAALKAKLAQEIDYIGNLYGSVYAPKSWKESHLGWNLPAQVALAQTKLAAATTLNQARQAAADLINSTADYHVGFEFYSTEKATLPFQVKTVEGHSLIVYINRDKLGEAAFPFEIGDEVLTMDQMPVAVLKSQFASSLGTNVPETDDALADLYLTRRAGKANVAVPHGPVTLSVKRAADGSVGTVTLTWEYIPEQLAQATPFFLRRASTSFFDKRMISPKAMMYAAAEPQAENTYGLGVKKSFLPNMGERIWESAADNTFDAYIYQNDEGQLIGVVRIFGYIVEDYDKAAKDFAGIIRHFERHTAGMVIDQLNNPGGSVFYLYALASMMSDQALTVPKHSIALTAAEARQCLDVKEMLKDVKNDEDAAKALAGEGSGLPMTYQIALGIVDYCNLVLAEYQSGKQYSSQYYLWGVDKITPSPTHYTKPVLLLVNQLDFSGGDFFPAIMQDNKRVKILGTRTAGAGGYVLEASFPNNLGLVSVNFTGSIAERVNQNPIENLGVTPDVKVAMTVEDLRNGYVNYLDEVRTTLKDMLQ
jgi:hypothetical protein